jgi:hypothetical protein
MTESQFVRQESCSGAKGYYQMINVSTPFLPEHEKLLIPFKIIYVDYLKKLTPS